MTKIGLLGAGRIGQTHAKAVFDLPDVELAAVYDPVDAAAEAVIDVSGARRDSVTSILTDPQIDGIIIATPTDLHAEQICAAAKAGKAIFCEKPIDLDVERTRHCLEVVKQYKVSLMVGFNRRYDPQFTRLKARIDSGDIGAVELVQITSRDPAPPPMDYIERSGGLFRDMTIHDFDMARFLVGEEFVSVNATGSAIVDPDIGVAGDIDTACVTLKTASGKIVVITNSRRASYGYDQRIEIHGQTGMLSAGNPPIDTITHANSQGYQTGPLMDFFMERYAEAYRLELAAFARLLKGEAINVPTGQDGLQSLQLADAAAQALERGKTITL